VRKKVLDHSKELIDTLLIPPIISPHPLSSASNSSSIMSLSKLHSFQKELYLKKKGKNTAYQGFSNPISMVEEVEKLFKNRTYKSAEDQNLTRLLMEL